MLGEKYFYLLAKKKKMRSIFVVIVVVFPMLLMFLFVRKMHCSCCCFGGMICCTRDVDTLKIMAMAFYTKYEICISVKTKLVSKPYEGVRQVNSKIL